MAIIEAQEGKVCSIFPALTVAHPITSPWPKPKVKVWGTHSIHHEAEEEYRCTIPLYPAGRGESVPKIQSTTFSLENPESTIYLLYYCKKNRG